MIIRSVLRLTPQATPSRRLRRGKRSSSFSRTRDCCEGDVFCSSTRSNRRFLLFAAERPTWHSVWREPHDLGIEICSSPQSGRRSSVRQRLLCEEWKVIVFLWLTPQAPPRRRLCREKRMSGFQPERRFPRSQICSSAAARQTNHRRFVRKKVEKQGFSSSSDACDAITVNPWQICGICRRSFWTKSLLKRAKNRTKFFMQLT